MEDVNWKERALNAEKKLEKYQIAVAFAKDIVNMWPTVTLRTLYTVTAKVAHLKEAITFAED